MVLVGRRAALLLAMLALSLPACREPRFDRMVTVKPPAGWSDGLDRARSVKNDQFRKPGSPLLEADVEVFEGLDYWPADERFYFAGPVNLYAEPQRFQIPVTSGELRPCEKIGWIEFRLDGTDLRLQVYRLLDIDAVPGGEGLFLPFSDGTTGTETYPAGRYINLEGKEGGPYVLDFNKAYNPYCAYGAPERYACPRTPPENRLPVRVEAGERGFRAEGESG